MNNKYKDIYSTKLKSDDNSPLLVYHASDKDFNSFDKSFLTFNTIAKSSSMGFFFSKDKEVAMSYFSNASKNDIDIKKKEIDLVGQLKEYENIKKEFLEHYKKTKLPIWIGKLKDIGIKIKNLQLKLEDMEDDNLDFVLNDMDSEESIKLDNAYLYSCYLNMQKPFIHDYESMHYSDKDYTKIIEYAIKNGYDSVIIKNTYDGGSYSGLIETDIYVVFEPEQIIIVDKEYSSDNTNESKHIHCFESWMKTKR